MRAGFAFAGTLTAIIPLCWLWLAIKQMRRSQVSLALMMTMGFIFITGVRIAYGNWLKLDTPIAFADVVDQTLAIGTIYGGPAIAGYALWAYWQNRSWD